MNRRLAACLILGFSSGLPLNLTQKTLQAWMSVEKVDLTTIGLFSLASLPYSLKFQWAPILDRFSLPFLGKRRGWVALFQVLLAVVIGLFSLADPRRGLEMVAVLSVLVAFLSASQDIAFDAWRVEALDEKSVGTGTGLGILGYRLALVLTGSVALLLAPMLGWHQTYLCLAVLQLLLLGGVFLAPEADRPVAAVKSLKDSFVEPWKAFHIRWGLKGAVGILGFVIFYKWGVYLVSGMSTPFLIQSGYTVGEVGAVVGGAGLGASILGTMAGAAAMSRLTLERALWLFGITQAVCGLQFWHLAHTDPSMTWMMSAVVSEYFFIGMGSVALVAFMTRVCDVRFSATQFAVLSSAMAASRDLLTSPSGIVAESLGWPNFFLFALVASVPGLLLLPLALKAVREDAA